MPLTKIPSAIISYKNFVTTFKASVYLFSFLFQSRNHNIFLSPVFFQTPFCQSLFALPCPSFPLFASSGINPKSLLLWPHLLNQILLRTRYFLSSLHPSSCLAFIIDSGPLYSSSPNVLSALICDQSCPAPLAGPDFSPDVPIRTLQITVLPKPSINLRSSLPCISPYDCASFGPEDFKIHTNLPLLRINFHSAV